jgi:hypothetical protein
MNNRLRDVQRTRTGQCPPNPYLGALKRIGNGFDAICELRECCRDPRVGKGRGCPARIFGDFIGQQQRSKEQLSRFVDVTDCGTRFGGLAVDMSGNCAKMILTSIAAGYAVLPPPDK